MDLTLQFSQAIILSRISVYTHTDDLPPGISSFFSAMNLLISSRECSNVDKQLR